MKEGVVVGVRVRGLLAEETGEEECVRVEAGRVAVAGGHRLRQFPFLHLFDRSAAQQQVFDLFALPLLEDLFRGHSCSLVAYGQNRSGKSFTICGGDTEETKGVIPRIVDHLACKLYAEESNSRRIIMRVSYVDIWQEEVIDLLSIRKGVSEEGGEQNCLAKVELKTVGKVEEIETHFILGNRKRQLAYSKKYRPSEHTASVFSLHLETLEDGRLRTGKLDIVEMAASEVVQRFPPALGHQKEKQYDLSRNSFRNVVNSLIYGTNDSLVPYNDSKITQILRNSLGGNAKAKILFHICPSVKSHDATLATLRTASACTLIENTPSTNLHEHSLIQQIVQQQAELTAQLASLEQEINNYSAEEGEEEAEVDEENEFLSRSVLLRKRREERESAQQKRIQLQDSLKKQLQNLQSLFLVVPPLKNKHQLSFFKDNYASALDRIAKNAQPVPFPSLYESTDNWTLSETSFRKLNEKERYYKQEAYDLHREFQQERELLLGALREVTQQCRFFEQVAERAVRPEELELLRSSARYDPTRRVCRLPAFAIREKRISHASRFNSPQQLALINSRAISERKFMMTQIGDKPTEVKQITTPTPKDSPYFHREPKRARPPKLDGPFRMSQDEYELVRSSVMSNRLKKPLPPEARSPSSSSRSVKVKPIKPILSPRFRFK